MKPYQILFFLFSFVFSLHAQWQLNGVAVCDTVGNQHVAANGILSDGAGGAFIVWGDNRDNWDIYAQRVDSSGRMLWGRQGKAICIAPGWQFAPRVAPDGEGGFVLAWHDTRNDARDIYAQRVDEDGNILWAEEGVEVVHAEQFQGVEDILFTTDSCFIISWTDGRTFPDTGYVYAQKINKNGKLLWDSTGIKVSTEPWGDSRLACDTKGGAIIVWAMSGNQEGVLAQRLDKEGNAVWGTAGVAASSGTASQGSSDLSVTPDGFGGAYIAWDFDLETAYIQRIDGEGNPLWGASGIQLGNVSTKQSVSRIELLKPSPSSVLVMWRNSPYTYYNIYENDIPVFGDIGRKLNDYWTSFGFDIAVDDLGNILIANSEYVAEPNFSKIRAHKILEDYEVAWDSSGISITDIKISPEQFRSFTTVDGSGGIITAWDDDRNGFETDIFIQRVYANGVAGGDTTTNIDDPQQNYPKEFKLNAYPNPFNNTVNIEFSVLKGGNIQISAYDISGRRVWAAENFFGVGKHKLSWNGKNSNGEEVSSGIYVIKASGEEAYGLRKVVLIK